MDISKLIGQATNPEQYDSESLAWEKEGKPTSTRTLFFKEYLATYQTAWQGKNLLDVGAGTGWLLEWAKSSGAESAVGIEPSKKLCEMARTYFPGIDIRNTILEKFTSQEKFDIIVAVMSFSHLKDAPAATEKIADLLKPSGLFVNIIPDYDYFKAPRHDYRIESFNVSADEYVSLTTRGFGTMADIIRKPETYIEAAASAGLALRERVPMTPTAAQIAKTPKYAAYKDTPICQLLNFAKPPN